MKINMLLSGCLLGLLCFTACDSEGNEMNDYTHYVNPFIFLCCLRLLFNNSLFCKIIFCYLCIFFSFYFYFII